MKVYWSGADGNPELDVKWRSVAEYLQCFHYKTAGNIGFFIPNGAIRVEAVGWENRPATEEEIRAMQDMIRQGMAEGALGLSSGLGYPPSIWADADELIELCKIVAEYGGVYTTHVRYGMGDGAFDGFKEAVKIGERSGVAMNISHFHCTFTTRGRSDRLLQIIDEARANGVDITFDSYPYEYGTTYLALPFLDYQCAIDKHIIYANRILLRFSQSGRISHGIWIEYDNISFHTVLQDASIR
ncbi:unnamed protein product [marine sediment metagenome]|uniref:Amidohydrolase 3 domain-containing protein n=1 Tax=marine sediment metagenome TaxID=412755 RepID=X1EYM4_9ZZZZ